LELAADEMQQSILLTYYHNSRTRLADLPKKFPWWSVELSNLRAHTKGSLIKLIGIHIEMPLPDTIQQLEKLRDNHGGSTVRG
jgi:hypothetical protein